MTDELYALFLRNFPFAQREEATARAILAHPDNRVWVRRDENGRLIGAAVARGGAILLLCVDAPFRRRGLGAGLLAEAEADLFSRGADSITVGAGGDYLTPGVPTSHRYYPAENEALSPGLDDSASRFFENRGYRHSWDCNCFDMRFLLRDFRGPEWVPGQETDGVTYRWAGMEDMDAVCACTDAAWADFTQYYRDPALYRASGPQRVLLAEADGVAAGALIVSRETEGAGVGSVGCTAVRPDFQGRHIAVNMVILGTSFLKASGLESAFLGYTYSGLDHMYGYAGYKICTYYMMAQKPRPPY